MEKIKPEMLRAGIFDSAQIGRAMPKRTIHSLKLEICGAFGITQEEIEGNSKKKSITLARKIFAARARLEAGSSLSEIGAALGGRDHTVIMYYLRSFPLGKSTPPAKTAIDSQNAAKAPEKARVDKYRKKCFERLNEAILDGHQPD